MKHIHKALVLSLVAAILSSCLIRIPGFSKIILRGEGPNVVRTMDLDPFTSVYVSGPLDVTCIPADGRHAVEVEMPENLQDSLNVDVRGGRLVISFDYPVVIPGGEQYRVKIYAPAISGCSLVGSGDMTVGQLLKMPLRPPVVCSDEDIFWGTHTIIAHKDLEPDDVQFPLHLARQGRNRDASHPFEAETLTALSSTLLPEEQRKRGDSPRSLWVEWGFASAEIPWESVPEDLKDLLNNGKYYNSGVQIGISGEYCGKTLDEILQEPYDFKKKHRGA